MNQYPILTNARSSITYEFSRLRMQGLYASFLAKLSGRNSSLKIFSHQVRRENPNRKYLGVKSIRVTEVVGTLNRDADFDNKFRPCGKHLLERWARAFLSLNTDGWSPIVAHKVGDEYYVEDGHHRVSVARSVGMMFIEAIVWEYSKDWRKAHDCQQKRYVERNCECIQSAVTI